MNVLRLLGYQVERNVTINGCQIDLLAVYQTGPISLHLMVECKDYKPGDSVGIDEIKRFAGTLLPARGKAVDKGLFVTASDFTRQAKELANSAGIDLITFTDLSTQLVDLGHYLDKVIDEYRNSPVYPYYIDLAGTDTENYRDADESTFHRPLDDLITRRLFEQKQTRVALLGNFGTGKTTFCRKYAHDLAKAYQADSTGRIPIIIDLRDYDSKLDIQQLVTNTLQFRYGVRIDLTLCQELQRLGRFLLILDGLDEMAIKVDPDTIRDNLREIDKITRIDENKLILTCRTHFFRDRVHASVLVDYETVYIPEWGEKELEEYLRRRFGDDWQKQFRRIQGTHNLSELAETPLFLEMIVETLPKLGAEVRRRELYETYTDNWITEQSRRRGARLDADQRRCFVTELALRLYREKKSVCHYREFASIIRERLTVEDAAEIDYLQSDVRTCTFLTRDEAGDYGFRHKSFMEYFVAESLAADIFGGRVDNLESRLLPPEVKGFLIELLEGGSVEKQLKDWAQHAEKSELRDNAVALLASLRIDLSDVSLDEEAEKDAERKLYLRFLQGETEAFDEVFRRFAPRLRLYAVGRGLRSEEAEDVAVEALMKLWEYRERLERIEDFEKYLYRVSRNLLIDRFRREMRRESIKRFDVGALREEIEDPAALEKVSGAAEYAETIELLDRAMSALEELERAVIQKHVLEGGRLSDVAKELRIPLERAYSARRSGLRKLREQLLKMGWPGDIAR